MNVVLGGQTTMRQFQTRQSKDTLRNWVQGMLDRADVRINGDRPWDIQVHNEDLWRRIAAQGSLGFGEAYMDGFWDVKELDQFFAHVLGAHLNESVKLRDIPLFTLLKVPFNPQSRKRSLEVAEIHYNLGNAFYESMLDPQMQYTCGYYGSGAKNLDEAQEAKLNLVCRKLGLKPGEKVLELGCGWGGFARYAARNFGVEVEAYNISREQVVWAREHSKGLPIEYHLQDYRDATGAFDKVVSIGMCEHVGPRNFRSMFELVHKCLKPEGLFLLHTIGSDKSVSELDRWMAKYIFPGGLLPSPGQLGQAMDNLFVLEDWHNFGVDYDPTLMAWNQRFEAAWPKFRTEYGDRFYRMWRYYLLSCAGSFRSRYNQLYQLVLSKGGLRGGWKSVR